ncbi:MAG: right-handed parallel beta-helix repeat-containing protein [Ignisphaera sp.]|uniref:pectate lyase n=1 Tax=Ignisphaera aggregans TaxID=334771 RepID=A0A7C4JKJ4_9CREN
MISLQHKKKAIIVVGILVLGLATQMFLSLREAIVQSQQLPPGVDEKEFNDRLKLLSEASGFGAKVIGGLYGKTYYVTRLDDERAFGTLRYALENPEPLWIRFNVSGTITPTSVITVKSFKTIDGRGAEVIISGFGLKIASAKDVIIANIRFDTGYEDALAIEASSNVWIHRCDFTNWGDGAIDIKYSSTNITISWNRFWNHNKVMLIGHSPDNVADKAMKITIHHNYFFATVQRHPRVRFATVDVFNNYYYNWESYAIGSSQEGLVLAEANIFEAGNRKEAIVYTFEADPLPGCIKLVGNLLLNGTTIKENCPEKIFSRSSYYTDEVEPATEKLKLKIMWSAGTSISTYPRIMIRNPLVALDDKQPPYVPLPAQTNILRQVDPYNVVFKADIPPYKHPSESVIACEWNFGDGSRRVVNGSCLSPIEYRYKSPGLYLVSLTLYLANGLTLTTSGVIAVDTSLPSNVTLELSQRYPSLLVVPPKTITYPITRTTIRIVTQSETVLVNHTITVKEIEKEITTLAYTETYTKAITSEKIITFTTSTAIKEINWLATTSIAVTLLVLGFAMGWVVKRR